jgi:hypothetical protein
MAESPPTRRPFSVHSFSAVYVYRIKVRRRRSPCGVSGILFLDELRRRIERVDVKPRLRINSNSAFNSRHKPLRDGTLFILDVLWVCRVGWEREVESLERVLIDVRFRDKFRS